jgi:pimeloyl-ACP methyl ester carboxylesterase
VLLHAGTQSADGWVYQQPVLSQVGYRVIAYSRRGYAGSDSDSAADPAIASDDLHCLIRHLGVSSIHLVAAAHGGFFAIDYALSHPEVVATLSVISSLMGIQEEDYLTVTRRLRPASFGILPHDFQELSPSYRAGDPEGLAAWNRLTDAAVSGGRVTPLLRHRLDWALLESLRMPILLMTGCSDLFVPPALLRMQAAHLPGAEVHVIAEAGHSPYWEQPRLFNRILIDFLQRHRQLS